MEIDTAGPISRYPDHCDYLFSLLDVTTTATEDAALELRKVLSDTQDDRPANSKQKPALEL
jgi:hypothetical protein